jgi:hypothetical protein
MTATIRQPVAEQRRDLAAAFAELQNLVPEVPEVTDFLTQITQLASAVVGAKSCGDGWGLPRLRLTPSGPRTPLRAPSGAAPGPWTSRGLNDGLPGSLGEPGG